MGRLRRYRKAFERYRHGKGFGIHSPFAFNFVLKVLRERLPYYSYARIDELRSIAIDRTRGTVRHPRIISSKNAKLVFRIANFFNPRTILQIGTDYGVSSASVLAVSSASRMVLCESHIDRYAVTRDILADVAHRITPASGIGEAIALYDKALAESRLSGDSCNSSDGNVPLSTAGLQQKIASTDAETPAEQAARRASQPFLLINNVENESDLTAIESYIEFLTQTSDITIIVRNLSRKELMRRLWSDFCTGCRHGMSFSNDRFAVFVANRKLPRQDFAIWF